MIKVKNIKPPYYAVIFVSKKSQDIKGYDKMGVQMFDLVQHQEGYLGHDAVQDTNGKGITISYWKTLESIEKWKNNIQHQQAKQLGKEKWYSNYTLKIAKVEKEY